MRKILFIISFALLTQSISAQSEISGVTPASTIEVSGQKLIFNGAGLREKLFLDLYVGALYVTSKNSDANVIINTDESMAITLDIVSGLISSEKMISAINDGFEKATKENTAILKGKIQSFKEAFKDEITEGDHFVIAYIKGQGTEVHKNGKNIKMIQGLDFKKALFGIWFCNEPADEDLKKGMLGKS